MEVAGASLDPLCLLTACLLTAALLAACTGSSKPGPPDGGSHGAGPSPTPSPSHSPTEPPVEDGPPSSQALIAADLQAGKIDLGTSLELRAWVLFADPRLPETYDGAGSSGEDETLWDDIAANLDTLPADQRAALQGYLLRPTDPGSPFSGGAPGTGGTRVASATEARRCTAPQKWFSQDWSPDGDQDLGFRVWACGSSKATVQDYLDKVLDVASKLWGPMTAPVPQGMGLPVPDTGSLTSDGNGKVDVYLLDPFAECRQRGDVCQVIAGDSVASAPRDRPQHCGVAGYPPKGCSGYLLLGRERLDSAAFEADFAHEFFHLLQHAHNGGIKTTWYHEASAVWAEWFFARSSAKPAAYDHYRAYQKENRSLLWYDYSSQVQYRAWGWPLFQYAELGPESVFNAWQAIEGASSREDVDAAVDRQLPFASRFRDFAVRNAQPAAYIPGASTGLDADRWQTVSELGDFPTDPHLVTGRLSNVSLGKSSHAADIDPLAAQYDEYQVVDKSVRQVTIDIRKLTRAAQADLDVLGQVGAGDSWRRFKGSGGKVTLCRDKPSEDVSFFQAVISDHLVARSGDLPDFAKRVKGSYTIEAKKTCDPRERYVAGTITWHATDDDDFATTVSGRLDLVLHDTGGGLWVSERGEGSAYTYDVSLEGCSPDGHLKGVVESGVGSYEPEWHIANAIVLQTDLTDAADLQVDIYLYDEWDTTCTDPLSGQTYPWTGSSSGLLPGCNRFAEMVAENDGSGQYRIGCDIEVPGYGWTGHIEGELHPIDGPEPSPPVS